MPSVGVVKKHRCAVEAWKVDTHNVQILCSNVCSLLITQVRMRTSMIIRVSFHSNQKSGNEAKISGMHTSGNTKVTQHNYGVHINMITSINYTLKYRIL